MEAPTVQKEKPVNVGIIKELLEYQNKIGFKNVIDGFEVISSRSLFSKGGIPASDDHPGLPPDEHSLYGDHALHDKYVDHALHSDKV